MLRVVESWGGESVLVGLNGLMGLMWGVGIREFLGYLLEADWMRVEMGLVSA